MQGVLGGPLEGLPNHSLPFCCILASLCKLPRPRGEGLFPERMRATAAGFYAACAKIGATLPQHRRCWLALSGVAFMITVVWELLPN